MKILINDLVRFDGTLDAGRAFMAELDAQETAYAVQYSPTEQRALIRAEIAANAGDTLSLLGTASDGAQLVLFHFATLVRALSTSNSLAEVRAATDAFAPLAEAFLTKVENNEVKLPFHVKGEAVVLAEIEARANAISTALTQGN